MLPMCLSHLQSSNHDTKFNCLKIFSDVIIFYLGDQKIYEPEGSSESTKKINELILKRLFP